MYFVGLVVRKILIMIFPAKHQNLATDPFRHKKVLMKTFIPKQACHWQTYPIHQQ